MVASVATAQARSSSSLVPLPSKVLHSVVQPEKRILVPRATVQFVTPSPASGATTLPLNCTQGSPPANGLVGVGSSSTVVHRLPRSPGKSCGAALAGGARRPTASPAIASAQVKRRMSPSPWLVLQIGLSARNDAPSQGVARQDQGGHTSALGRSAHPRPSLGQRRDSSRSASNVRAAPMRPFIALRHWQTRADVWVCAFPVDANARTISPPICALVPNT